MLVLQRCENGVVTIGHNAEVRVTVLEVRKNGSVRLGFEADPSLPIHRLEVFEAIQRENAADKAMERIERDRPTVEADAALISSAPDLLAACEAWMSSNYTNQAAAEQAIRAAVAKARGEGDP